MKLLSVIPLAHATGPDVGRSAAGRAGGECRWVPTAVLPRFGARWAATGASSASVSFEVDETPLRTDYDFDADGRVRSSVFDRWGDPDATGAWGWHRCGGEVTSHRTFGDLTIPASGRVGWHLGTERENDGEFFRYEIIGLVPAARSA